VARKDTKEPEDEYEFIPPDFDEEAFIHKEMVSFRTTAILFVCGIVAAVLSWALFAPLGADDTGWWIGLLVMAALGYGLKWLIPALKTDISHWGRREWTGTGFLYFFTWLAFFILLVNPPVSDFAAPEVVVHAAPEVQEAGGAVSIDVLYADNDEIASHTLTVTGPDGAVLATEQDLTQRVNGHYALTLENRTAGVYAYVATAKDPGGHETRTNGTFEVRENALRTTIRDLTDPTQILLASVPADLDLFAVFLDMDRSECGAFSSPRLAVEADCRVYLEYDESLGGWKATSNFAGWREGGNTFHIVAQERNTFEFNQLVRGGELVAGPHTVQVATPGGYDKPVPGRPDPTTPPPRDIPGVEAPVILVGLLGLAVAVRRRRAA